MKFARAEYEITKADYDNLENKIESFLQQSKTRKSIMLTMVTSFGIKENIYSSRVQRVVTMEQLFGK